ncbi:MAG: NYN domain-containing protein [Oscillospiraceae bacterium]|jgi:uncharacterized LabA/DUF88 family protein|nr:NYN domain-containing protein [Oscillospiraceae bacterium]
MANGEAALSDLSLAVLIDSDNVPYAYVKEMLEELARYGTPTIKRIYGDWTQPTVSGWKNVLLENAITPIQQYSYTYGKNSTDSAMIIDAMDILYANKVDGFCIVSSDSDFTRLCTRLREAGKKVFGMGEKKTPQPFIAACDKFIFIEILKPETEPPKKAAGKAAPASKNRQTQKKRALPKDVLDLLARSVESVADDDGWAFLGDVGNMISKKQPSFDARNYGFMKLSQLFNAAGQFEIDRRDTPNRTVKHIYIKLKAEA